MVVVVADFYGVATAATGQRRTKGLMESGITPLGGKADYTCFKRCHPEREGGSIVVKSILLLSIETVDRKICSI